ncbi:MAG: anthranilate synthase component I [Candidatus Omnitrophica bacterium]|nr:anthranilate synthase component I [Candidatus Omnitrophota bacterium]
MFPSKRDFLRLSKKGNLIPVYREILGDLETPVSCFLKLRDKPYSYLLESVEGGERMGRFSFVGGAPSLLFKSTGRRISLQVPGEKEKAFHTDRDPLFELEKVMRRFHAVSVEDLPPFSGGAVGYMGYDAVRFFERLPDSNPDPYRIPDLFFVFTDSLFVFDHVRKKIKVVCSVFLEDFEDPGQAYDCAVQKVEEEIKRLRACRIRARLLEDVSEPGKLRMRPNFRPAAFERAVLRTKDYIRKGDVVQAVLSQAFQTPVRGASFDIYRALRSINPSPYMFYLNCGDFQLIGSSPEIHVRCEDHRAALRPIAGTRPRGASPEEDARLEKELLRDSKERAEHVMLVDLGRNDLGRVCDYRTVNVPEFMTIERYSHVMHIVSHVEGRLRKDKTVFDLLRATFPAGTVTGAPKVRAMEIIDELENRKRSFYSGIVGYFGYSGNLDSCITIRTILVKDRTAFVQAGAGIVADSHPRREYEETLNKAKALFKAIEMAEGSL